MLVIFASDAIHLNQQQYTLSDVVAKIASLTGQQLADFFASRKIPLISDLQVNALKYVINAKMSGIKNIPLTDKQKNILARYPYLTEHHLENIAKSVMDTTTFNQYKKKLIELVILNNTVLELTDAEVLSLYSQDSMNPNEDFNRFVRVISKVIKDNPTHFDGLRYSRFKTVADYTYDLEDLRELAEKYGMFIANTFSQEDLIRYLVLELKDKNAYKESLLEKLRAASPQEIINLANLKGIRLSLEPSKEELINYLILMRKFNNLRSHDAFVNIQLTDELKRFKMPSYASNYLLANISDAKVFAKEVDKTEFTRRQIDGIQKEINEENAKSQEWKNYASSYGYVLSDNNYASQPMASAYVQPTPVVVAQAQQTVTQTPYTAPTPTPQPAFEPVVLPEAQPAPDPFGAQPAFDPFGSHGISTADQFGGMPIQDPFGAQPMMQQDPFAAQPMMQQDPFAAQSMMQQDPFGAQPMMQPDPYAMHQEQIVDPYQQVPQASDPFQNYAAPDYGHEAIQQNYEYSQINPEDPYASQYETYQEPYAQGETYAHGDLYPPEDSYMQQPEHYTYVADPYAQHQQYAGHEQYQGQATVLNTGYENLRNNLASMADQMKKTKYQMKNSMYGGKDGWSNFAAKNSSKTHEFLIKQYGELLMAHETASQLNGETITGFERKIAHLESQLNNYDSIAASRLAGLKAELERTRMNSIESESSLRKELELTRKKAMNTEQFLKSELRSQKKYGVDHLLILEEKLKSEKRQRLLYERMLSRGQIKSAVAPQMYDQTYSSMHGGSVANNSYSQMYNFNPHAAQEQAYDQDGYYDGQMQQGGYDQFGDDGQMQQDGYNDGMMNPYDNSYNAPDLFGQQTYNENPSVDFSGFDQAYSNAFSSKFQPEQQTTGAFDAFGLTPQTPAANNLDPFSIPPPPVNNDFNPTPATPVLNSAFGSGSAFDELRAKEAKMATAPVVEPPTVSVFPTNDASSVIPGIQTIDTPAPSFMDSMLDDALEDNKIKGFNADELETDYEKFFKSNKNVGKRITIVIILTILLIPLIIAFLYEIFDDVSVIIDLYNFLPSFMQPYTNLGRSFGYIIASIIG